MKQTDEAVKHCNRQPQKTKPSVVPTDPLLPCHDLADGKRLHAATTEANNDGNHTAAGMPALPALYKSTSSCVFVSTHGSDLLLASSQTDPGKTYLGTHDALGCCKYHTRKLVWCLLALSSCIYRHLLTSHGLVVGSLPCCE